MAEIHGDFLHLPLDAIHEAVAAPLDGREPGDYWDLRVHRDKRRASGGMADSALIEAGLGVSLAPASIRRIRLKGVAYRRIEPDTARTTVAIAWRRDDDNPLVSRFLQAARSET
jgi:hypothetical protein